MKYCKENWYQFLPWPPQFEVLSKSVCLSIERSYVLDLILNWLVFLLECLTESRNLLKIGENLCKGHKLTSENGFYESIMQIDGNFVIVFRKKVLWQTNTTNISPSGLQFRKDGSLVILDSNNGEAMWHLSMKASGDSLKMESFGNLVLLDATGSAIWKSNTSGEINI